MAEETTRQRRHREHMEQLAANDAVDDFANDVAEDVRAADREIASLRAELAAVRAERDEARREVERLKGLLHRDRTGLAAALVEVKKRAAGGRWISEGRGSYAWDEDDYRKETGWLVTDIVRLAEEALHASGNLANEAFHPRPPPITPGSPDEADALAVEVMWWVEHAGDVFPIRAKAATALAMRHSTPTGSPTPAKETSK